MLIAQQIVKLRKPSPPAQARLYAYAANAYDDVLTVTGDRRQAGEATRQILALLSPDDADMLVAAGNDVGVSSSLSPAAQSAFEKLRSRMKIDGAALEATANKTPPVGDGKWVSKNDQVPAAVTAGSWTRWIAPADHDYAVAPPNNFASAAQRADIEKTRSASELRDARWVAAINYWGGTPGTEGPSGVWQNHVWRNVQGTSLVASDGAYAHMQAVLAESIADSFIETWKIKYTYWTARPDMLNPTIRTSMPNPPFPGYVSGHSTISATAATVLAALIPDKADFWMTSAAEARDSRLYAGIHLPQDNAEGFMLGKKVGDEILQQLKVSPRPIPVPEVTTPTASSVPATTSLTTAVPLPIPVELGKGLLDSVVAAGYHGGTAASLWKVSKPGVAKAFLIASSAPLPTINGWSATKLHTDDVWQPGSCSSNPSVVVGNRYEVFSEWRGTYEDGTVTFGVFDLQTKTFRNIVWKHMPESYPTGALFASDDHTVTTVTRDGKNKRMIARSIDVRSGSYVDRELSGMPTMAIDDAEAFATSRSNLGADGYLRIGDDNNRGSIDGVTSLPDLTDRQEIVFVDTTGAVKAKIFSWRGPSALGWDDGHGYFLAQSRENSGFYVPGVYDTKATQWDWAIDNSQPGLVALGTVSA
jgi:PAP2 superfamily